MRLYKLEQVGHPSGAVPTPIQIDVILLLISWLLCLAQRTYFFDFVQVEIAVLGETQRKARS